MNNLLVGEMKCPNCGAKIKITGNEYETCEYCGSQVKPPLSKYLIISVAMFVFVMIFMLIAYSIV